jgi:hypothetical protein
MLMFLADAMVTTEQAAQGLADQTWNKPASWILGFFLGFAIIALIILIIRTFRKSDINENLLREANADRLRIAELGHKDAVQTLADYKSLSTQVLTKMEHMDETISELKEEFMKFIYRGGK